MMPTEFFTVLLPRLVSRTSICFRSPIGTRLVSQTRELALDSLDTIYALASAQGRAGVSIVRVSGPQVPKVLQRVCSESNVVETILAQPRKLIRTILVDRETNDVIDKEHVENSDLLSHSYAIKRNCSILDDSLTVYFKGEDVLEFHLHGSQAVIEGMLDCLSKIKDLRAAGPGEFTKRAYINGKLTMTAVEGLSDLLEAQTSQQRIIALHQLTGATQAALLTWKDQLISLMAQLEAWVDFSEDENIESDVLLRVKQGIKQLHQHMQSRLNCDRNGELIRRGIRIALIGRPNAGKSSLLNLLAERRAALVSSKPGTTRDAIEVAFAVDGIPIVLIDTAGIRRNFSDADEIEQEGIKISLEHATQCDLIFYVIDVEKIMANLELNDPLSKLNMEHISCQLETLVEPKKTILILNKMDLINKLNQDEERSLQIPEIRQRLNLPVEFEQCPIWPISCINSDRTQIIKPLINLFKTWLKYDGESDTDDSTSISRDLPILVRERHRSGVVRAINYLEQALESLAMISGSAAPKDPVLAAEALRKAAIEIGRIVGYVDPEQVLDALFSNFCIGK